MAANEVKKDKLIDQLEKLIPAELLNDGESDRILRNAVADAIRKLKQPCIAFGPALATKI